MTSPQEEDLFSSKPLTGETPNLLMGGSRIGGSRRIRRGKGLLAAAAIPLGIGAFRHHRKKKGKRKGGCKKNKCKRARGLLSKLKSSIGPIAKRLGKKAFRAVIPHVKDVMSGQKLDFKRRLTDVGKQTFSGDGRRRGRKRGRGLRYGQGGITADEMPETYSRPGGGKRRRRW